VRGPPHAWSQARAKREPSASFGPAGGRQVQQAAVGAGRRSRPRAPSGLVKMRPLWFSAEGGAGALAAARLHSQRALILVPRARRKLGGAPPHYPPPVHAHAPPPRARTHAAVDLHARALRWGSRVAKEEGARPAAAGGGVGSRVGGRGRPLPSHHCHRPPAATASGTAWWSELPYDKRNRWKLASWPASRNLRRAARQPRCGHHHPQERTSMPLRCNEAVHRWTLESGNRA
jgi:hypothetical protein